MLQAGLSLKSFGAKGDGISDDTQAIRSAVAACLQQGRTLLVPSGKYLVKDTLKCYIYSKEQGRRSLVMIGEGPANSIFLFEPQTANSVLFEHAEWFLCKNIAVRSTHDKDEYRGVVFATPPNTQSAWSVYESISVQGKFKYAWYQRFTMHDQWRNIKSHGPLCHFMFATSNNFDQPLAKPARGWNGGDQGWFHNLGTMDGVICDGGEVGVAGAVMQFNFVQLTTQGQQTGGGAANQILPKNEPGTGLYLCGVDNTPFGALRGNTIGAFYTEVTERPLYARNAGVIAGSSAFFQGNAKKPYAAAIVLDNTRLRFAAITTRQPFEVLYQGSNKAALLLDLLDGGSKCKLESGAVFRWQEQQK